MKKMMVSCMVLWLGCSTIFASNKSDNAIKSKETITQLREKIDQIDIEIQRLLDKRARTVLRIGKEKTKQSKNYPIKDLTREQSIIKRACQRNHGPLSDQDISNIFQTIIQTCRNLEYNI
jgi:chorismate mutase/prephenate dehydratase